MVTELDWEMLIRPGQPDLALYRADAVDPLAVLVFVHGFGEHMGRYEEVFEMLPRFDRCGFDLRGHGHSAGRRGHVRRFADYHDDLAEVLWMAQRRRPELPCFLVAHSFGGLIAADFVARRSPALAGLVLSSPGFAFRYTPPLWERAMASCATHLMPTLTRSARLDVSQLSHDPEVERRLRADPLSYSFASVRWYTECRRVQRRIVAGAVGVRCPVLGLIAGRDALVDPAVTAEYFAALSSRDKTEQVYAEDYHELFQESHRAEVVRVMRHWCMARR